MNRSSGSLLKWCTHIHIARGIARAFDMELWEEESLVRGSVDPDRIPDIWEGSKVSHHGARPDFIMGLMWASKVEIIRGDRWGGIYKLGRALHYLQDREVPPHGRSHRRTEERMASHPPSLEAIRRGLRKGRPELGAVERTLRGKRPSGGPGKAVYRVAMRSAAVATAVLWSPDRSPPWSRRWAFSPLIFPGLALGLRLMDAVPPI